MNPSTQPLTKQGSGFAGCLEQARRGDHDALCRLVENCIPYLHFIGKVRRAGRRRTDSDLDLVQETVVRALRGFDRFRGSTEDQLLAWMRRIFLNLFADHKLERSRRPGPLSRAEEPTDLHTPTGRAIEEERAQALERALLELDESHREVILLRHRDDLMWEEIGRRTGRSADAARMVHFRALKKLTRLMLQSAQPLPVKQLVGRREESEKSTELRVRFPQSAQSSKGQEAPLIS